MVEISKTHFNGDMENTELWRYGKHIMMEIWKTQNDGDMENTDWWRYGSTDTER